MRALTPKEKLELLNNTTPENIHELNDYHIQDGKLVEDPETKHIFIKIDIRQRLKDWMTANRIKQVELAKRLGMGYTNFNAFIRYEKPLPLERIEQLLWLMENDNILTDETIDNTRIIKQ